jgi:hypothetical protein
MVAVNITSLFVDTQFNLGKSDFMRFLRFMFNNKETLIQDGHLKIPPAQNKYKQIKELKENDTLWQDFITTGDTKGIFGESFYSKDGILATLKKLSVTRFVLICGARFSSFLQPMFVPGGQMSGDAKPFSLLLEKAAERLFGHRTADHLEVFALMKLGNWYVVT